MKVNYKTRGSFTLKYRQEKKSYLQHTSLFPLIQLVWSPLFTPKPHVYFYILIGSLIDPRKKKSSSALRSCPHPNTRFLQQMHRLCQWLPPALQAGTLCWQCVHAPLSTVRTNSQHRYPDNGILRQKKSHLGQISWEKEGMCRV